MEHSNEFPDLTMQFHNPPPQFRMMPLWFWNHEIRPSIIKSQIEDMARHGMGGFFINARPGRLTPYMSKNFLEQIEYAADCSQAMNLWCNLYDEDNYPSGFAGGKITGPDFPENRAKFLFLCDQSEFDGDQQIQYEIEVDSLNIDSKFFAALAIQGSPYSESPLDLSFGSKDFLDISSFVKIESKLILDWKVPPGHWSVFFFCIYTNPPNSRVNGYIDILRKDTVSQFIEQIYSKYVKFFEQKQKSEYLGRVLFMHCSRYLSILDI